MGDMMSDITWGITGIKFLSNLSELNVEIIDDAAGPYISMEITGTFICDVDEFMKIAQVIKENVNEDKSYLGQKL